MKRRLLCFFAIIATMGGIMAGEKLQLILDADTANEIDDLYAIARMLSNQDRFEVIALTSAQWFHRMSGDQSVFDSQKLNEDLLRLLGREDLPAPVGANEAMGNPWGGTQAKDSPAAQFIIEAARATPEGEKLIVASLGASTNLACALKLAPEIAPKISAYLLGFKYDVENGIWNKSEFNIRRDLNAADFLLNHEELDLHVLPTTVAIQLKFRREEAFAEQAKMGALGEYLTDRWNEHAKGQGVRIMWDLALVIAMVNPELATEKQVMTPPENTQRKIWIYDTIDPVGMLADYRAAVVSAQ